MTTAANPYVVFVLYLVAILGFVAFTLFLNRVLGPKPRASALKLEPLSERDKAWREERSSSRLEPAALSGSFAPVNNQPTVGPPRRRAQHPTPSKHGEVVEGDLTLTNEARASTASRKPRLLLGVSIGAGLMAVVAGALLLLLAREPASAPAAARFIVVESPERKARAAEPVAAAAEQPASAPVESAPPAIEAAKPEPVQSAKPVRASGASALTRQFARRQPALEACFERYAAELQGRPEISVNFEVATSGRVSSAALSPAALNGTPLGDCLLSIARATDFGPQAKPVAFAIPLLARVVKQ